MSSFFLWLDLTQINGIKTRIVYSIPLKFRMFFFPERNASTRRSEVLDPVPLLYFFFVVPSFSSKVLVHVNSQYDCLFGICNYLIGVSVKTKAST